jgi:L-ascorbate metabolism protein UlaG (beta-lactamase superfamily)
VIVPLQQGDALLADIEAAGGRPGLHLWWLGQSGFLVQQGGAHLLFDPYLSDALPARYAGSQQPHERMTERVIAPEHLGFIDAVTSSHNHTDHLDAETLLPLLAANPELDLLVPRANLAFAAERLQLPQERLTPLTVGELTFAGPFELYPVPAAHDALDRDAEGRYRAIGLIVRVGPWTLYHSGDTVLYPGLAERLAPWRIDVAMLPIDGRDPARGVAGNLSGPEAAALAREAGIGWTIPCHFETFRSDTASPDPFAAAAEAKGIGYRLLRAGERASFHRPEVVA